MTDKTELKNRYNPLIQTRCDEGVQQALLKIMFQSPNTKRGLTMPSTKPCVLRFENLKQTSKILGNFSRIYYTKRERK